MDLDSDLAWTVREGVTNVIRHSRARGCEIRATRDAGEIIVEISDNGPGTPAALPGGGNGLTGLAERLTARGGRLTAEPREPVGYRLRATLPLRATSTERGG